MERLDGPEGEKFVHDGVESPVLKTKELDDLENFSENRLKNRRKSNIFNPLNVHRGVWTARGQAVDKLRVRS